jgi:hypothetical protein
MADDVKVDDEQDGTDQKEEHGKDEERGEQKEKKQERGRDSAADGLAIAAALILASRCGRGGRQWLPPVNRPGETRIRTSRGDGWWCW